MGHKIQPLVFYKEMKGHRDTQKRISQAKERLEPPEAQRGK